MSPVAALLGCVLTIAFIVGMLSSWRYRGISTVTDVLGTNSAAWWTLVLSVTFLHAHLVPCVAARHGKNGLIVCLLTLSSFAGAMGTCYTESFAARPILASFHSFFSLLTFILAPLEVLLVRRPPLLNTAAVCFCTIGLVQNRFSARGDLAVYAAYEVCFIVWFAAAVLAVEQ